MTVERIKRRGAVVPRLRMLRNDRNDALASGDRLDVAADSKQCMAPVEQRPGMVGEDRERAIVFGERLVQAAEPGERVAAIDSREMPRLQSQYLVEASKRLVRSLLDQQQQ